MAKTRKDEKSKAESQTSTTVLAAATQPPLSREKNLPFTKSSLNQYGRRVYSSEDVPLFDAFNPGR